jgi:hypothetical protein
MPDYDVAREERCEFRAQVKSARGANAAATAACAWQWRAYLAYDPREDEQPSVVVICPSCAVREFGPRKRRFAT